MSSRPEPHISMMCVPTTFEHTTLKGKDTRPKQSRWFPPSHVAAGNKKYSTCLQAIKFITRESQFSRLPFTGADFGGGPKGSILSNFWLIKFVL